MRRRWKGGFVGFSDVRHGFMDGLQMRGTPLPRPAGPTRPANLSIAGFYRHGRRVIFTAYALSRDGDARFAPWADGWPISLGRHRLASTHPWPDLAGLTKGGPLEVASGLQSAPRGTLGTTRPYAVDTIEPPFDNPWKAPLFFGDHDFLPDGTALICTIQGDVWRVEGAG